MPHRRPTSLRFFDTAEQRVVAWQPPREVGIYVCGITPYDSAHLGHILTFMTYDLLQRYLEDQGHTVVMVRNVTDVDEPIYKKAAELGIDYRQLAAQETASFREVLTRLNFRSPAHEPLASQYIGQMAAAVRRLVAAGYGYYVDRDIYFDTARDPQFGQFSGFSEPLQLGLMKKRGGDPGRPGKRQPLDFMLWRAVEDPDDPAAWSIETPDQLDGRTDAADRAPLIPRGRPGWHIECSVMSSELLGAGQPFELHGGGNDLIFPHHECEIAQTRALRAAAEPTQAAPPSGASLATVPPLARHWLHVAPLHYCGEKMSKSLGNLVFARDLLQQHEPSVIRLALMNYHYRIGGEWNPCLLEEAAQLLQGVRHSFRQGRISPAAAERFARHVRAALANDLDTHAIMHALMDLAAAKPLPSRESAVPPSPQAHAVLNAAFNLLGLSLEPPAVPAP